MKRLHTDADDDQIVSPRTKADLKTLDALVKKIANRYRTPLELRAVMSTIQGVVSVRVSLEILQRKCRS